MIINKPVQCPFCYSLPTVEPLDPEKTGGAWGMVRCDNEKCIAKPEVIDDLENDDEVSSDQHKARAIELWNKALMNGKKIMTDVKFCKDCKFYCGFGIPICEHPSNVDLVSGKFLTWCSTARNIYENCGREAKFFEPRGANEQN